MGFSDKKTKSTEQKTSQTASTATTTPNVPDWIADPSKQIAGNISGFLNQGPDAYTPQVSALQKQAFDAAGHLGDTGGYLDQAARALGGAGAYSATDATASSLLDGGLDKYYNPFKDQVLNPVLADYDQQSGETRAAQAAAAARNKSFQGSRYGIQEAATEGQLARGRASTEGGLLGSMYTQATGLADSDAGRRQQVSLANAAAANQASAANQQAALQQAAQYEALAGQQRSNLGVQAGLGGVQTDQENAIRQYPLEYQRQQEALLSGLNPELYTGKTLNSSGTENANSSGMTSESDPMGGIGKAAQIAALFMSDRRVKRDVETLGYDARGHRWVSFAYVWEPLRRLVGVIAQEARKIDPQAVVEGPDGYLMVNYAALR